MMLGEYINETALSALPIQCFDWVGIVGQIIYSQLPEGVRL